MIRKNQNYPWSVIPSWIPLDECAYWKSIVFNSLIWEQPVIKLFGKKYSVPRKTSFMGKNGTLYSYSGINQKASGWTEWMLPLLARVNQTCFCEFNGCLFNLYRDGNDSMGWHSDNETELDNQKPIASLSFGATRDFVLKHRYLKYSISIKLGDGDLLIMYPPCQKEWIHSLPKRRKINQSRINLTFRCFLSRNESLSY